MPFFSFYSEGCCRIRACAGALSSSYSAKLAWPHSNSQKLVCTLVKPDVRRVAAENETNAKYLPWSLFYGAFFFSYSPGMLCNKEKKNVFGSGKKREITITSLSFLFLYDILSGLVSGLLARFICFSIDYGPWVSAHDNRLVTNCRPK